MRMASRFVLFAILFFIHSLYARDIIKSLEVTFITNEAFLIECYSKKILVDALYTSVSTAIAPPAEVRTQLENAEAPFDNIDVIFVTHIHQDHFGVNSVGKHLEQGTGVVLVCPDTVALAMQDYPGYNAIKDRIQSFSIASCIRLENNVNGIPFSIIGLNHANLDKFPDMKLAGYLINLDGIILYHAGDSWGEYLNELTTFQLQNENIDVAFFHYNYFYKGADKSPQKGLTKVVQYINPANIIVMHNEPSTLHGGQDIIDSLKTDFNNIYLFTEALETRIFYKQFSLVQNNIKSVPQRVRIEQNYPNPFNAETTIRYQIETECLVKLSIYNMLGHKISTLVDSRETEGEYTLTWNGRDDAGIAVSSGVYFYTLTTSERMIKKKMILIR